MANTTRLVELSMVPPLAKEVATQIDAALAGKAQVAALVALTDNSGGTADDTVAVVPAATAASTDTSAASLASTNTALTAIKNDIADLAGKINAVIAALKA
jgi:hypothetical protein